jgi:hypothetical protein
MRHETSHNTNEANHYLTCDRNVVCMNNNALTLKPIHILSTAGVHTIIILHQTRPIAEDRGVVHRTKRQFGSLIPPKRTRKRTSNHKNIYKNNVADSFLNRKRKKWKKKLQPHLSTAFTAYLGYGSDIIH